MLVGKVVQNDACHGHVGDGEKEEHEALGAARGGGPKAVELSIHIHAVPRLVAHTVPIVARVVSGEVQLEAGALVACCGVVFACHTTVWVAVAVQAVGLAVLVPLAGDRHKKKGGGTLSACADRVHTQGIGLCSCRLPAEAAHDQDGPHEEDKGERAPDNDNEGVDSWRWQLSLVQVVPRTVKTHMYVCLLVGMRARAFTAREAAASHLLSMNMMPKALPIMSRK